MAQISPSIARVLDLLARRGDDQPGWWEQLREAVEKVAAELRPYVPSGFTVRASAGFGYAAKVPWVAVLPVGGSSQAGYFPVLLFAADGSRAYLSLNQGTLTVPTAEIKRRTAELRRAIGALPERWLTGIDLRTSAGIPRKYAVANVYAIPIERDASADQRPILADLRELIALSTRLRAEGLDFEGTPAEEGRRTWIFQSKPDLYDLESALQELGELSWLVNQHQSEIRQGDRAYLWESGADAGVVAESTVLTDPAETEDAEEERQFWRNPEAFEGPRRRVRLAIDRLVEPRLLRETLTGDPVLGQLEIIRRPTGTNFPVTPEQARLLERRIDERPPAPSRRRVLKVAPGRDALYWDDCLAHGYICVGWDDVGDLRAFASRDAFLRRFAEVYPSEAMSSATSLWRLRELEPGDLVIANRGIDEILGVGTVVEPGIDWAPERAMYRHVVHVEWNTGLARKVEPQSSWRATIRRIAPSVLQKLLPELAGLSPRPRRYFVAITSPLYPEAWDRAKELRQWGAPKMEKALAAIAPGDKLLIWLGRKGFSGVADAVSGAHEVVETAENSWHHGSETYPFRVDLGNTRDFPAPLYPPFPRGQNEEYGLKTLQFAGRSLIELEEWQYERIIAELLRLNPGASVPAPEAAAVSLPELADFLCLAPAYLADVDWLLRDKKQLVFYGPPGTGKTFVAEEYAGWFTKSPDRVEIIQFHPSYAYEDFVEGIRPVLDVAELRYRMAPGLLKQLAERATKDRGHDFVLIIDEINRANLARVFGELLYLLEYRSKEVTLPYSGESFSLPPNLYLIGTMNTADRSIALVDFALRRRFHFIEFPADAGILRKWLLRRNPSMAYVADLLDWVNKSIDDRDFAIGFSYFMREQLDEELLNRIWERSILPALDEFYFDNRGERRRFVLDNVRKAVAAEAAGIELTPALAGEAEIEEATPATAGGDDE
jgi:hypothetical protein